MKREDLHKYKRAGAAHSTSNNTTVTPLHKAFPLCHFLQFVLASVLLLGILLCQNIMETQDIQSLYDHVQENISVNFSLPNGEWSGSLKEIFFTVK